MNYSNSTTRFLAGSLLLALASTASGETCGVDDYCIDWWTIDSGGEMFSESDNGQWQLSGTIGQWEASSARELSGADWRLTGGFWGVTLEELADQLFRDRFEPEQ